MIGSGFSGGNSGLIVDYVDCFGTEERLFDCGFQYYIATNNRTCMRDGVVRCMEGGEKANMLCN